MSGGKRHILFVDDEGEVRFTLSRYFKQGGYEVSTAASADEALRAADAKAPDFIILDVNLAGEDGLALMSFLKRNHPDAPIILYTGIVHNDQEVKKFLELGATSYVPKGKSLDELRKVVEESSGKTGK